MMTENIKALVEYRLSQADESLDVSSEEAMKVMEHAVKFVKGVKEILLKKINNS